MRPATIAIIILVLAVLAFGGYSLILSQNIKQDATTIGTSTSPKDSGSIQDAPDEVPTTENPKGPLQDSNVPPAGAK